MPWTAGVFLVAAVSMSGFPLLSGFWSKDAILLAAEQDYPWLMWTLVGGAVMTSAYIFRLYLLCFHGAEKGKGHAHESPWVMVAPMILLALGAVFVGLLGSPVTNHELFHLLGESEGHHGVDLKVLVISLLAASAGFGLAWAVGVRKQNWLPQALRPLGKGLYTLAFRKYYVDECYQKLIIEPFAAATRTLARFDLSVIDGWVNGTGRAGRLLGEIKAWVDQHWVDGFVNASASLMRKLGGTGRRLQTGILQQYLLIVIAATVVLSLLVQR